MPAMIPFRLAAAFTLAAGVGACSPTVDADIGESEPDGPVAPAGIEANLPTSPTAVRIALFNSEDHGVAAVSTLRAWPAWFVSGGDNDSHSLVLVGDRFGFAVRDANGVPRPTADVEFGAPPADVVVNGFAAPVVLVVHQDVDLEGVEALAGLPADSALGVSSYLGFADGALTIDLIDGDTEEPMAWLDMPLLTVGAYVESAPEIMTCTLR
jgi:hypothetical protein